MNKEQQLEHVINFYSIFILRFLQNSQEAMTGQEIVSGSSRNIKKGSVWRYMQPLLDYELIEFSNFKTKGKPVKITKKGENFLIVYQKLLESL